MRFLLICVLFVFIVFRGPSQNLAIIDTTFGNNGIMLYNCQNYPVVSFPSPCLYNYSYVTNFLSDGRFYFAGGYKNGSNTAYFVTRFHHEADIDITFGQHGYVFGYSHNDSVTNPNEDILKIDIQSDDKLILMGKDTGGFTLPARPVIMRLHSNGEVDSSFATAGKLKTDISHRKYHTDRRTGVTMYVLDDDRLLLIGCDSVCHAFYPTLVIKRILTSGLPDVSYYSGGSYYSSVNFMFQCSERLPQGGFMLAGFANSGIQLIRLLPDGLIDTAFNPPAFPFPASISQYQTILHRMAIQPDGKILISGYRGNNPNSAYIIRFNSNGAPDSTFGSGGVAIIEDNLEQIFISPVLYHNNLIYAAGYTGTSNKINLMLTRLNDDGTVDNSFGTNGKFIIPMDKNGVFWNLGVVENRIMASGVTGFCGGWHSIMMRFIVDLDAHVTQPAAPPYLDISLSPNPVINTCEINIQIDQSRKVFADLYNAKGEWISSLLQTSRLPSGELTITHDTSHLSSGIYFIRIATDNQIQTLKMIKL